MARLTDEEKAYIVKDHSQLQELLLTGNLTQIRRVLREAVAFHGVPRQLTEDTEKAVERLKLRNVTDSTKRTATLELLEELLPKLEVARAKELATPNDRTHPINNRGRFNGMMYRTPLEGVVFATKEAKAMLRDLSLGSEITTELVEKIETELGELRLEDNGTIVLTTPEIKLTYEDTTYSFGEWELHHHSLRKGVSARKQYMEGQALRAVPLRPNYHQNGYPHPHVLRGGSVCMGDGSSSIRGALRRGDLFSLFEIWLTILTNYGEESPYARLETWRNREPSCRQCGKPMKVGAEIVHCERCKSERCPSCAKQCGDCGKWLCNRSSCSLLDPSDEETFFCRTCRASCSRCEGVFQKSELTDDVHGYRYCIECQRSRLQGTADEYNRQVTRSIRERTQWLELQQKAGLGVKLESSEDGVGRIVVTSTPVEATNSSGEEESVLPDGVFVPAPAALMNPATNVSSTTGGTA